MTEHTPCSQYDTTLNRCQSGHVRIHPTCWGGDAGCPTCGTAGKPPMCMQDDLPAHLTRDNGLPLGWPSKVQP